MNNFIITAALLVSCLLVCSSLPVTKTKKDEVEKPAPAATPDVETALEYERYLKEVVEALESDPEFRKKLDKAPEADIRSGKIAQELDYVNHHVRTKLDEIKRRELERLRSFANKEYELSNDIDRDHLKVAQHHLDHGNEHTFEIEDLRKLIKKTSEDLAEADRKRREEFKEYEMQKEFEQEMVKKELDEKQRKKYEEEQKQLEEKHKKHDKVHHPGNKAQLEEVWEEQDHMDKQDFDPHTFFMIHAALLVSCLLVCSSLPVTKTKKDEVEKPAPAATPDVETALEYERYLKEVVEALESDPEFRKKLDKAPEADIRSGKIAQELDYVNHHVRTKLDEIKRRELERLRSFANKEYELSNDIDRDHLKVAQHHLDHGNEHTFEIEDLRKLIKKTSEDLAEADRKRREEFKEYEMQKEFEQEMVKKELDEKQRKKYEEEQKQLEEKHKKHDKVHHPGNKAQLEEVWEEQDHMDKQDFDPHTFFMIHDVDGNGFWDETEVKALFIKELDKVYKSGLPEDDMRERAEEMERMREHVFQETDTNRDGLISFQEFLEQTKRDEFNRDPDWQTLEEQPQYTHEEYLEFERRRKEEVDRMIAQGMLPPHPNMPQGYYPDPNAAYHAGQQHPAGYQQPQQQPQMHYQNPQQQHVQQQQQYQQQQQQYQQHNQQQQYNPQPQQQQQYNQQQYNQQQPQQQQYNQQQPQQQQYQGQQVHLNSNQMYQHVPAPAPVPQQPAVNNNMPPQPAVNNNMPQQPAVNNNMPQQQAGVNNNVIQQAQQQQQPVGNNNIPTQQQPVVNNIAPQKPVANNLPPQQHVNNNIPIQQQPVVQQQKH